jgi:hypothetical protein
MNEQEKIIDAVKTIKNMCENQIRGCYQCVLWDGKGYCLLGNTPPDEWSIPKFTKENGGD